MPETGTDNEDALLLKELEISKLQARLAALEAAVMTTSLPSAGTSPATENATGDT